MSELPQTYQPTVEKIYQKYIDTNGDFRRNHLGASLIGEECERKLWFSVRWASDPNFNGRMIRLFSTGFKEESRIINDLRNIGITVWDRDPDSGDQIRFVDPGCPHFSGSLDAVGRGFEEAPKTPHVVEIKSSGNKSFLKIKKEGVEKAKPLHYAQMQTYCRWAELDRAFYFVVNKDNDEIYSERIYYEKIFAECLAEKAKRIVYSNVPLEKICDNPENFQCKFCPYVGICHRSELPLVSCRTCAFVTPEQNGTWTCGRTGKVIEPINQRRIQDCHIFIPELVPLKAVDSDPEAGTITYDGGIVNGPCHVLSKDLARVLRERGNDSDMYETHMECSSYDTSKPDMAGVAYGTGEYDY
ncbi:MAG: oxidoreductase [Candidatus Paceibacterota bacterium]|jgi:hypothetical protein